MLAARGGHTELGLALLAVEGVDVNAKNTVSCKLLSFSLFVVFVFELCMVGAWHSVGSVVCARGLLCSHLFAACSGESRTYPPSACFLFFCLCDIHLIIFLFYVEFKGIFQSHGRAFL